MSVLLHRANYGYRGQGLGHGLLSSSLNLGKLDDILRGLTDLPSSSPYGVTWDTYYSAFNVDGYYILTKTFHDSDSHREDTVFTSVILIPHTDVEKIQDLNQVIHLFPDQIDRSVIENPIKLENALTFDSEIVVNKRLIHELVNKIDRSIICLGNSHEYIDSIAVIWNKLPNHFRKLLTFRTRFNPNNVREEEVILFSPRNLEYQWNEFPIVKVEEQSPLLLEDLELYFSNEKTLSYEFTEFLTQFQNEKISFKDLKLIADSFKLLNENDPTKYRILVRNIAYLSPSPENHKELKQKLITPFSQQLKIGSAKDILRLRNLSIDPFDGITMMEKAIGYWIKNNILCLKEEGLELINEARSTDNLPWWNTAILKNLKEQFQKINKQLSSVFWQLIFHDSALINVLFPFINHTEQNQLLLSNGFPSETINKDASLKALIPFIIQCNWLVLHAEISGRIYKGKNALKEHLKVDQKEYYFAALNALCKEVGIQPFIDYALINDNPRVIHIIGIACIKDKTILNQFDAAILNWQKIWLKSIESEKNPWKGINDPGLVMTSLLDQIINKQTIVEKLLEILSKTTYGNIQHYKNRKSVWRHLPVEIKKNLIEKTIDSILVESQSNFEVIDDLESPLKNELLSQLKKGKVFQEKSIDSSLKIKLIRHFELSEEAMIKFLNYTSFKLNENQAKEIGILIYQKKWSSAAKLIDSKKRIYPNLSLASDQCKELIKPPSFFGKLKTGMNSLKQTEMAKQKILFMSAGPSDQDRLNLDRELRKIEETIESAKHRERFDMKVKVALTFPALTKVMAEEAPNIIHFSGHGDHGGLALENEQGGTEFMDKAVIDRLFSLFKGDIECILLNACYSKEQAHVISKNGTYVIGMNDSIGDEAAITFSSGFYQGLGANRSIQESFELAKIHLLQNNTNESETPELWFKGEIISIH